MCPPSSPKTDHQPSRPPTPPSPEDVRQQAKEQCEAAADARAQNGQLWEQARQLRQERDEILQQHRAHREHEAEQRTTAVPVMAPAPHPLVEILLIEESPADIRLFHEALKAGNVLYRVVVLQQEREVADFVRQQHVFVQARRPQCIFIDSCVPGMEVQDLIVVLRSLPGYREIPIILFSALDEGEGQRCSAQWRATAFVQKPSTVDDYFATVQAMLRVWGGRGSR